MPASSLTAPPPPCPPVVARQMWFLEEACAVAHFPPGRTYVCPLPLCSHPHIFVLWDSSKALIPIPEPSQVPLVLSSVTAPEDTGADHNSHPCLQLLSGSLKHMEGTQVFFQGMHEWTGFRCVPHLAVFPLWNRDALKLLFDCREWSGEEERMRNISLSKYSPIWCPEFPRHFCRVWSESDTYFPPPRIPLQRLAFALPFEHCSVQVTGFTARQHSKGGTGVPGGDGNVRSCSKFLARAVPFSHCSFPQLHV